MKIVFCGVGALGSHAVMMSRNIAADLVAVDFDRVESKNLQSQAFVKQSVGKNKAQAVKMQLANFYARKIEAFGVKVTAENIDTLLKGADLIVDCFDNKASRDLLSRFCAQHNIALIHGAMSANADFAVVRWDEHFHADEEDEPGQTTCEDGQALAFINRVASHLADAILQYVTHKRCINYLVSANQTQLH